MAKTTLKIVERETTVSREKVREAISAVTGKCVPAKPYGENSKLKARNDAGLGKNR
jgi:hypothetical protein